MKKHKCKVCKKPIKQKTGPGRPKTTHDRCKGTTKKKTKKKKKKKTKKKTSRKRSSGAGFLAEHRASQQKLAKKSRCSICKGPKKVGRNICKSCADAQIQAFQESASWTWCDEHGYFDCDCPGQVPRRNPFRRNVRIGAYRPGDYPRQPSESKKCEFIVTDEKTGITKPCGKITRDKKIYCPVHVGEHGYVKELMERLAGKSYEESIPGARAGEAEAEKLEVIRESHPKWSEEEVQAEAGAERLEEYLGRQEIDSSITMEEILLVLKLHGGRSIERLGRDINVTAETAKAYVALLKRRGLVTINKNKRGARIVELPKKRRLRRRNPWSPEKEPNWRGTGNGELFDVPRLFVFNGVSISTDMLLNELYNMKKDQQAIIVYDGARYRISGYGYEKGNIKIVLENIIKFTPESLIKFILTYEKR